MGLGGRFMYGFRSDGRLACQTASDDTASVESSILCAALSVTALL